MTHEFPLVLAAVFYFVAFLLLWGFIRKRSVGLRNTSFVFAAAGVLLHAGAQYGHWFGQAVPDVSLPHLLSLCALVVMVLLLTSTFSRPALYAAGLVALPIATGILLLEWVLPHGGYSLGEATPGIAVHVISSVLAFGLISIAGVYALFVFIIDHVLRRHHLSPLVRSLPPLVVMEDLLFKTIAAGFVLLSVSLLSGIMFIDDIFAQHLVHKTILSIMAWLLFGIMLWGRWRYGWRGSLAVRLTLVGIILLVLAYFGSKLVLEMILGKSWQS
jgi:ABC-type uncharacterized transport system permease subunit